MTDQEVKQLIDIKLADFSDIVPESHRIVEYAILDAAVKTKIIELPVWERNRQYSVDTSNEALGQILSVIPLLKCTTANNGFQLGDIMTAPTPERNDSGGIPPQGIGVQFNNNYTGSIKVLVNDVISIMQAYTGDGDTSTTMEPNSSNFSILLVVNYFNPNYSYNPLD